MQKTDLSLPRFNAAFNSWIKEAETHIPAQVIGKINQLAQKCFNEGIGQLLDVNSLQDHQRITLEHAAINYRAAFIVATSRNIEDLLDEWNVNTLFYERSALLKAMIAQDHIHLSNQDLYKFMKFAGINPRGRWFLTEEMPTKIAKELMINRGITPEELFDNYQEPLKAVPSSESLSKIVNQGVKDAPSCVTSVGPAAAVAAGVAEQVKYQSVFFPSHLADDYYGDEDLSLVQPGVTLDPSTGMIIMSVKNHMQNRYGTILLQGASDPASSLERLTRELSQLWIELGHDAKALSAKE